ncbi:MAG: response regulator transcription factor [Desulfobacterales bacterium]|nr:response regulator transcription factor [Desulfobacterales bacterium]
MIKVLHIDDDQNHHELIKAQLGLFSDDIAFDRVESERSTIAALEKEIYDCILTDDRMPEECSIGLLNKLRRIGNFIPFALLSEVDDEEGKYFRAHVLPDDEFHIVIDFFHFDLLSYWIHHLDDKYKQLLRGDKIKSDLFRSTPKRMEGLLEAVKMLSARELQIFSLIGAGKSNMEIADELFISYKTVKNHVANVFSKLGIHTRAEAIHLALGLKIFDGY